MNLRDNNVIKMEYMSDVQVFTILKTAISRENFIPLVPTANKSTFRNTKHVYTPETWKSIHKKYKCKCLPKEKSKIESLCNGPKYTLVLENPFYKKILNQHHITFHPSNIARRGSALIIEKVTITVSYKATKYN